MAGDHQHVGLQGFDLGERHRHVVELGRQLIVDHDHHAVALHVVEHAGAHILRERIVLHRQRNLELVRLLAELVRILGGELDRAGEILVGGGQHGEDVAITLGEQLARSAVALDHRHAVFLDDRQNGLGQAGAVRPEHELDSVLLDQPLGELGAARRRRFVVVVADHELVGLAADRDAALAVDRLDGEIVAVLGVGAVLGVFAGHRDTAAPSMITSSAPAGTVRGKQKAKACANQPRSRTPHHSTPPRCLESRKP